MTIAITVCASCGHAAFPPRPLCPRCSRPDWTEIAAELGTVEEVTEHQGVVVVSVRTDAGPVVLAEGPKDAKRGDRVRFGDRLLRVERVDGRAS